MKYDPLTGLPTDPKKRKIPWLLLISFIVFPPWCLIYWIYFGVALVGRQAWALVKPKDKISKDKMSKDE